MRGGARRAWRKWWDAGEGASGGVPGKKGYAPDTGFADASGRGISGLSCKTLPGRWGAKGGGGEETTGKYRVRSSYGDDESSRLAPRRNAKKSALASLINMRRRRREKVLAGGGGERKRPLYPRERLREGDRTRGMEDT